ncbi:MAG: hypothetical protein ABSE73_21680 [Planctomycetota bacterium]
MSTELGTKKVVLLIPLKLNDGSPVPKEVLASIGVRLYGLCSGYTNRGPVIGAYRMADGRKQTDPSREIWCLVQPSQLDQLRDLVRQFGRELGQESMYFEVTGSEVDFIS